MNETFGTSAPILIQVRGYQCRTDEKVFSHSSILGGREWITSTGKLNIPDDPEAQGNLRQAVAICHNLQQHMCLVECTTPIHPFIEDIDVLLPRCTSAPSASSHLLLSHFDDYLFLRLRAMALHEIFPLPSIRMLVCVSSGLSRQKNQQKLSLHCIWPDILLDDNLAGLVRHHTLDRFMAMSRDTESPLYPLYQKLWEETRQNDEPEEPSEQMWSIIFDVTSVRAKSLRMLYCDKADQGVRDGRPLLPFGLFNFKFPEGEFNVNDITIEHELNIHSKTPVEWLEMASVRRPGVAQCTPHRSELLPRMPEVQAEQRRSIRSNKTSMGNRRKGKGFKRPTGRGWSVSSNSSGSSSGKGGKSKGKGKGKGGKSGGGFQCSMMRDLMSMHSNASDSGSARSSHSSQKGSSYGPSVDMDMERRRQYGGQQQQPWQQQQQQQWMGQQQGYPQQQYWQ